MVFRVLVSNRNEKKKKKTKAKINKTVNQGL